MKKSFLFGILLFMSSLGFAQNATNDWTATIRICPPENTYDIISYCLEYIPAAEADLYDFWDYIDVVPSIDENGKCIETLCVLTNLIPNRIYIVRVRALYDDGSYGIYSEYSTLVAFRTTVEPGNVDVIVYSRPLENLYAWSSTDIFQKLPERTLYRSKEEWEHLT